MLTLFGISICGIACCQAQCPGPEILVSLAANHPSAASSIELGNWYGNHQQFACAAEEFKAALRFAPSSTAALDGLCRSLLAEGDSASAVALLTKAHLNEVLTADLGQAQVQQGMLDEATQTLTRGLRRYPASTVITPVLGNLYVLETLLDQAVATAERSASAHPRDLTAQRFYLRMLVTNGDKAKAIPLAHRLLAVAPRDADLLYLAGTMERLAEDYSAAHVHLERSLAIDPNNAGCHYNLAVVQAHLGQSELAREHFDQALKLGSSEPQIHYQYALLLRGLGESEKAKEQLSLYDAATLAKEKHQLAVIKADDADSALRAGDATRAVALYREACEAQPGDARLAFQLAGALNQAGDLSGEHAALLRAVQIDATFALAQEQLGDVEARLGNIPGAEERYRLAVADAPQYTQAWIKLAATLARESRAAEARQAAANALQLEPANASALELSRVLAVSTSGLP